jgi:hypothetical protein
MSGSLRSNDTGRTAKFEAAFDKSVGGSRLSRNEGGASEVTLITTNKRHQHE